MSLAENLLNSLDETDYQDSRLSGIVPEEEHIIIGQDRTITVPNNLKTIAVKGDKDIETVTFDCVRYWDGHDLSTFAIYINYILPTAEEETTYIPKEITKFEDTFSFDWTIGREITSIEGSLKFWVVAKLTDDEGNLIKQWSSLQNSDCTIAPGGDKIYVPEVQTDKDVISQAISVSRNNAERAEDAADRAEDAAESLDIELPQEWVDINEAYEAIGEDDHKLLGGVIYKDFEGNIRVFPLSPPYGIRTDEVGDEYAQSAIAMYNSAQQLLVKPATDGRHAVPLSQLIEKLGMYLAKTGGIMTGKPEIKTSNPAVKLTDTTDGNSVSYVQAYQGKTAMGYSFAKSITVDKSGNAGVPGDLTVGGSISCTEIDDLTRRLNALADSDDITLDQLSEIVAYIKNNKSLIDSITTSKVNISDIVNNLNSDVANKPLSAAQGFALKQIIDQLTLESGSVASVNGKAGIVELSASDVGAAEINYVFGLEGRLMSFEPASEGLAYELNNDGVSYVVSGIGDCTDARIKIPNTYNNLPVDRIKDNAFQGQTQITHIFVPENINYTGWYAFDGCSNLIAAYINGGGLNTYIFNHCHRLSYIDASGLDSNVVGTGAFDSCISLTSIVIPDGVTTIGSYAFADCTALTSVSMGNSVTKISSYVFYNCRSLMNINFKGTMSQWDAITKGTDWDANTNNYTVYCTDGNITKS